jgi:hypothetical protein
VTGRFVKKIAQFCRKIAQNGALLNKKILPDEITDKIWKFRA